MNRLRLLTIITSFSAVREPMDPQAAQHTVRPGNSRLQWNHGCNCQESLRTSASADPSTGHMLDSLGVSLLAGIMRCSLIGAVPDTDKVMIFRADTRATAPLESVRQSFALDFVRHCRVPQPLRSGNLLICSSSSNSLHAWNAESLLNPRRFNLVHSLCAYARSTCLL